MSPRLVMVAVIAMAITTCIIPDREIGFAGGKENPGAVRILFRPPMLQEMEDFCNDDIEVADLRFCPAARASRPPGRITAGPQNPFCICPSGRDNRAIEGFEIYAEDPDELQDLPRDTLYGVLLLDPDPDSDTPTDWEAYRTYLEPCGTGFDVDSTRGDAPRAVPSEERDRVFQRVFVLDDGSGRGTIDLCNDNSGQPVPPGLHNLQFMVTDRPFFRPDVRDAMGEPVVVEGEPVTAPRQCGVPDLDAGATYAVADWVFECRLAGEDSDPAGECDCSEVGG